MFKTFEELKAASTLICEKDGIRTYDGGLIIFTEDTATGKFEVITLIM